jgi:hypothetical protein
VQPSHLALHGNGHINRYPVANAQAIHSEAICLAHSNAATFNSLGHGLGALVPSVRVTSPPSTAT